MYIVQHITTGEYLSINGTTFDKKQAQIFNETQIHFFCKELAYKVIKIGD